MSLTIALETIDNDIEMCKMWAHYWMTMAVTGVGKKRNMSYGDGTPFTDEQKIEDCLNTARNHLHRMSDLIDDKKSLIQKYEEMKKKI